MPINSSTPELYPLAEFSATDPDPEIIPVTWLAFEVELIVRLDKPVTAARLTAPLPVVMVKPDVVLNLNTAIPDPPVPPS